MALSLSFMTASSAYASPAAKPKTVSFEVRNDSADSVTIQAGDQQYILAPGKESKVKMAQGTQLKAVNATGTHQAGDVLVTVDSSLGGNTLVIK